MKFNFSKEISGGLSLVNIRIKGYLFFGLFFATFILPIWWTYISLFIFSKGNFTLILGFLAPIGAYGLGMPILMVVPKVHRRELQRIKTKYYFSYQIAGTTCLSILGGSLMSYLVIVIALVLTTNDLASVISIYDRLGSGSLFFNWFLIIVGFICWILLAIPKQLRASIRIFQENPLVPKFKGAKPEKQNDSETKHLVALITWLKGKLPAEDDWEIEKLVGGLLRAEQEGKLGERLQYLQDVRKIDVSDFPAHD